MVWFASGEVLLFNSVFDERFLKILVLLFTEIDVGMKDFSSFPVVSDQSDHESNKIWWF